MFLIVGLGNPGAEYAKTRHNVGFMVADAIHDKYGFAPYKVKFDGLISEGKIDGEKVYLLKPQTYMNLSGESVRALMDYYKIDIEDLLVIYDDISLDVGQIRMRGKGSAGGHNGIKSIIQHTGTQEFARIKIGVGQKPEGGDLVKHVLGRFSREEDGMFRDVFALAEEGLLAWLQEDMKSAMNKVNGRRIERNEA